MKKKIILVALSVFICLAAHATFTPVAVTGFTTDVVANGSAGVASSVSASFIAANFGGSNAGGSGYALVSQDYIDPNNASPTYYLPTGGLVSSTLTPGLTFQLADYASNNAIYLSGNGATGTLSFVTPQSAGAVYIVGASSGLNSFTITVNFSDGSSQSSSNNSVVDWYTGTNGSVLGIGRVSGSTGLTSGTATAPQLFEKELVLSAINTAKIINSVTVTNGGNSIGLPGKFVVMGVSVATPCTGTPTAGTVTASQSSGCSPYTAILTTTGETIAPGVGYQWQSSTDGINWTNVTGATNANYTATVTAPIYYRDSVVCGASGLYDISATTQLSYTVFPHGIATVPYFQSFESWVGTCYTYDRPDTNWVSNPNHGNQSWRRDDQGTDAGWSNPAAGAYSLASTQGAYSARYHSSGTSTEGNLDLHINLSTPGSKAITFDYINDNGDDYMILEFSEDSTNFNVLGTFASAADQQTTTGWHSYTIYTTSVAPDAIIRFAAFGDNGNTDMGIDSLSIATYVPCTPISALAASNITQTGATIGWTPVGGTGGYDVVINQSSTAPTGSSTPDAAASYNATGLLAGTVYYAHVRDSCGPNSFSAWTTITFTTVCPPIANLTATNITATGATIGWTATGTTGYEVVVNQTANAPTGSSTGVTAATYNATGLSGGTVYYAHVRDSCGPGDFSAWTTITFTTSPSPNCNAITGLTATGITYNSATITWNVVTGTAGYEYVVSTSATTPATGTGTTSHSYAASGLASNTVYHVFVRDSCGVGDFSAWDTLSFTTLHSAGIATVNGDQFDVNAYPNPATNVVTIQVYGVTGENRKVSLTDITGRVISTMPMTTDRVNFNMSNLAPGIYLVRYEDDGHARIIKVNKQ